MTRTSRVALLALILAGACRKHQDAAPASARPPADPAAADAQTLGREVFTLVDRAADYRGSHRGRYPASVARLGIDSLTPTTARRLSASGTTLTVTVNFRRAAGHAITACSGGADVLEAASLNDGKFSVDCVGADGTSRPMRVSRSGP